MKDINSLSHSKWNCKYHIVFAPKYRRKVFYGQNRYEIGKILAELCRWKEVHIVTGEACQDHIHLFVEIPPKISVSSFMGYLKGKSSVMIYERWGNIQYKYRNRQFWCRGYYVDCKEQHNLRFTRIRGILKNEQNSTMIFTCHNLKKMAIWRWKTSPNRSLIKQIIAKILKFTKQESYFILNITLCQQSETTSFTGGLFFCKFIL